METLPLVEVRGPKKPLTYPEIPASEDDVAIWWGGILSENQHSSLGNKLLLFILLMRLFLKHRDTSLT